MKNKVPFKKPILWNVTSSELENIDINGFSIQILPLCNNETASVSNQELSQETVPPLCKELPQDVMPQDPAPHLNESLSQKTASYSVEEQPSVSTTTTNPSMIFVEQQPSDDEYGDLSSKRKRSIKQFVSPETWDKSVTKIKCMKSEEYIGYPRDKEVSGNEKLKVIHDIPRPAREKGPRCTLTFCTK